VKARRCLLRATAALFSTDIRGFFRIVDGERFGWMHPLNMNPGLVIIIAGVILLVIGLAAQAEQ
jgi:hypothetical protein